MIQETSKAAIAVCICPECKNTIDLTSYPVINKGMVIECNHCGMTLLVKNTDGFKIDTEIVDEGK